MSSLVDILIEDPRWGAVDLQDLCDDAMKRVLAHLGLEPSNHEISVLACNDARIAELNAQFRGKNKPTNVLSWPTTDLSAEHAGGTPKLPESEPELGDIALAWETCEREARELERPVRDHVYHLVVHGTLHLMGYDHIRDKDAALMEAFEVAILGEIGIADPYFLDEAPLPDNG